MMVISARLAALSALALVAVLGCAQVQSKKQADQLTAAVQVYADAIRWGRHATAAGMLKARDGSARPPPDIAYLKDIRVTAFDTQINGISQDSALADVTVSFDYYYRDQGTIRHLSERSMWWYDETTSTWYSDGRLPPFTR